MAQPPDREDTVSFTPIIVILVARSKPESDLFKAKSNVGVAFDINVEKARNLRKLNIRLKGQKLHVGLSFL